MGLERLGKFGGKKWALRGMGSFAAKSTREFGLFHGKGAWCRFGTLSVKLNDLAVKLCRADSNGLERPCRETMTGGV